MSTSHSKCLSKYSIESGKNMSPVDIIYSFSYIDEGRNPQLYTKDCMEKAMNKNEAVKGKIDAFRRFRAHLLVELTNVFPTEMAKYRAIRGDERPLS